MDETPGELQEDRGFSISKKRIDEIKPEPTFPIFYKATRNSPSQILDLKFSRDAAVTFCERIHREVRELNSKSFTINGGDVQGFKDILDWIKQSVAEGKPVFFQELDESIPGVFTRYAHAIEAADYLGVPARDFSEGLTKRLVGKVARKTQMSWDEVEYFYEKHGDNGLREVAAASIFYAWWDAKLDEDTNLKDMIFLSILRRKIPELDEDLHNCFEKQKAFIEDRKAKKKAEREAQANGGTLPEDGNTWGGQNNALATTETGSWAQLTAATTTTTSSWDKGTPENTPVQWNNEKVNPNAQFATWNTNTTASTEKPGKNDRFTAKDGAAVDWADEVNGYQQDFKQCW